MKLKDTSKEMQQKQLDIILSKSNEERIQMGVEMIDAIYYMIKRVIQAENPNASKGTLIALLFERYYRNDFTAKELKTIMQAIKNAHDKA